MFYTLRVDALCAIRYDIFHMIFVRPLECLTPIIWKMDVMSVGEGPLSKKVPLFESYLPLLEERISKRAYPKGIKCSVPCGYDISVNGNHNYGNFYPFFQYTEVYIYGSF